MEPPNHKMYSIYSKELMEFLRQYTSDIEQVSVDECYMDFTGIAYKYTSPVEAAVEIKNKILEQFGFTVNIGISTNKLLAKMASDFEKPNRVHTLFPEEVSKKMWPLPVSSLYMAGRASVEVLRKLEINTIGELAGTNPRILELHLKSHGKMLWEFANGIDHAKVQSEETNAKGIGNSTTLARDVADKETAKEVLLWLSESVGKRLRKAGQKAQMISVEIKYYNFRSVSHQRQMRRAAYEDKTLYENACALFEELWNGEPIRLLGIRTSKLVEETAPEQLSIFDIQQEKPKDEKHRKLDKALDEIRKRFGEDAVKRGTFLK